MDRLVHTLWSRPTEVKRKRTVYLQEPDERRDNRKAGSVCCSRTQTTSPVIAALNLVTRIETVNSGNPRVVAQFPKVFQELCGRSRVEDKVER